MPNGTKANIEDTVRKTETNRKSNQESAKTAAKNFASTPSTCKTAAIPAK